MTKKKTKEAMVKVGGAFKDLLVASATHPATACLAVCTLTTIGQLINGVPGNSKKRQEIRFQLDGLFRTSRDLGFVCAAVPMVTGALGVVKEAIRKPTSGYP